MKTETKDLILFHTGSFLLSLLAGYLIWLQTSKYGIAISPDSTTYIRWAETISKEGWDFVINNKNSTFPPFYPMVLSLVSTLFHHDILIVTRWLNIVLFSVVSFLSLILCRKLTKNPVILFMFGLLVVFSKPMNLIFSFAWTEPLFIFILLLIIFLIEKTDYKHLVLCGFLTSLAILTRYAGIAIIPSVCLYVFIQKNDLSNKVKKCLAYAIIPTLTYIFYVARNYFFTGSFMGSRAPSKTGLISNFDRAFTTVTLWFSAQYFFITAFLFLVLGAFFWNYKKDFISNILHEKKIVIFSACFSSVYSAFIVISSTTTAYDLINDRLMSPVFLPVLLIVLFIVTTVFYNKKEPISSAVLLIFTVCFAFSSIKTIKEINYKKYNGAGGYATAFWQENKLLDYLNKHKEHFSGTLYSNNIWGFFIIDRNFNVSLIPSKKHINSTKFTGLTLENLPNKIPDLENSYLFLFNGMDRPEFFSLEELQSIYEMETIVTNSDGFIFKVKGIKSKLNSNEDTHRGGS